MLSFEVQFNLPHRTLNEVVIAASHEAAFKEIAKTAEKLGATTLVVVLP